MPKKVANPKTKERVLKNYKKIINFISNNRKISIRKACIILKININTLFYQKRTDPESYYDFKKELVKKRRDFNLEKEAIEDYQKIIKIAIKNKKLTKSGVCKKAGVKYSNLKKYKEGCPKTVTPLIKELAKIIKKNILLKRKKNKLKIRKKNDIKFRSKQKLNFLISEKTRIRLFKELFFENINKYDSLKELIKESGESYFFYYKCILYDQEFFEKVKKKLKLKKNYKKEDLSFLDSLKC